MGTTGQVSGRFILWFSLQNSFSLLKEFTFIASFNQLSLSSLVLQLSSFFFKNCIILHEEISSLAVNRAFSNAEHSEHDEMSGNRWLHPSTFKTAA